MPATSPTLSPTLSAITAGLRGSSSGMPASTLPTRSAPTSAALVKMPPPTRANSAMELAPMPKVSMALVIFAASSLKAKRRSKNQTEMSRRPRPTTVKPMTLPAEKATRRPLFRPSRQALAVRQLALVAIRIPTKPLRPEKKPPVRNANGTNQVSNLQAAIMHKTTIIQAKNTPTTVYCRLRYALAPWRMD